MVGVLLFPRACPKHRTSNQYHTSAPGFSTVLKHLMVGYKWATPVKQSPSLITHTHAHTHPYHGYNWAMGTILWVVGGWLISSINFIFLFLEILRHGSSFGWRFREFLEGSGSWHPELVECHGSCLRALDVQPTSVRCEPQESRERFSLAAYRTSCGIWRIRVQLWARPRSHGWLVRCHIVLRWLFIDISIEKGVKSLTHCIKISMVILTLAKDIDI